MNIKKTLPILILVVFFVLAEFVLPLVCDSTAQIAKLDRQMTTALELTGTVALTSAAIAAVPDDSTTPIADQIADVASYMTIACAALLLEKFIAAVAAHIACWYLFPIGFGIALIALLLRHRAVWSIASRVIIAGLALMLVIPLSLSFDSEVEKVLDTDSMVAACSDVGESISLWDMVTNVADLVAEKLNHMITLAAVNLLTCCIVPVLSLFLLLGVLKWAFTGIGELIPAAFWDGIAPPRPPVPPRHAPREVLPEGMPPEA